MSAVLKSTVKRNDVFISEDLVKDNFTSPINEKSVFLISVKKDNLTKRRASFYFDRKHFKMDRRACIQKDIDYFVEKYSLIEFFHGVWMNCLQFGSCSELHKKSYQYHIYCYSEACYKKWDQIFPDFLFLKDSFRKQLKLFVLHLFGVMKKSSRIMLILRVELNKVLLVFFFRKYNFL